MDDALRSAWRGGAIARLSLTTSMAAALVACGAGGDAPAAPAPSGTPGDDLAPGLYIINDAQGQLMGTTRIFADGTYLDTNLLGEDVARGHYLEEDGYSCFEPEGDARGTCWTLGSPDDRGVIPARSRDGSLSVSIVPETGGG